MWFYWETNFQANVYPWMSLVKKHNAELVFVEKPKVRKKVWRIME